VRLKHQNARQPPHPVDVPESFQSLARGQSARFLRRRYQSPVFRDSSPSFILAPPALASRVRLPTMCPNRRAAPPAILGRLTINPLQPLPNYFFPLPPR
jgi:hypothetical protein